MVNEVLVLGGGIAGGASAVLLARAGIPVCLLEREAGPHDKVCGEFLSVEAGRDLQALGLDPARLGAVPVDRVRLARGARQAEAFLPFAAQGVSRRVLDEALLELASASGAQVVRGVRVTAIGDGQVSTNRGVRTASQILLATGKHDVRGAKRSEAETRDGYVGFKMHYRIARRQSEEIKGFVELVLFDGGYAGLQLVAPGVLNLCLIVRRRRFAEAGGRWPDLFALLMREPHAARRLDAAEPLFPKPLTIANLPYGYVCDAPSPLPPGFYRLGDQAAMTASLSGDGMALALHSARLAARCVIQGTEAPAYHRRLRKSVAGQVGRAMMLQRASEVPLAVKAGFGLIALWPGLLRLMAGATRLPISGAA